MIDMVAEGIPRQHLKKGASAVLGYGMQAPAHLFIAVLAKFGYCVDFVRSA